LFTSLISDFLKDMIFYVYDYVPTVPTVPTNVTVSTGQLVRESLGLVGG
jgi:hypothetical protein